MVNIQIHETDGRWSWAGAGNNTKGQPVFVMPVGGITYSTRELAIADLEGQNAAKRDETGRWTRSKGDIDAMIRALVETYPDCAGVSFGPVHWHERDERGCNWNVAVVSGGGDQRSCFDAINHRAFILREAFSIPDEN